MVGSGDEIILHASCVALSGRGLIISGASGSGKSSLALSLMAYGAQLVSDDRVRIRRRGASLVAEAPERIRGLIEARGLGILRADPAGSATVAALVDLDRVARHRLPEPEMAELLGLRVPLICRIESAHFAPALLQYLKGGLWQDR